MSSGFQTTEGIILQVIPYGEYDQILIVFTPDRGVIKLFFKASRSKRRGVQGLCAPLTHIEIVYSERNSELFSCREIKLIDSYHYLRAKLVFLEVACDLLQIVSQSQLVCKPAPLLYELLHFYLKKIPHIPDAWALSLSFRLKLLKHEGLVTIPFRCSECQTPIVKESYLNDTEWYCELHRKSTFQFWEEDELYLLYHLSLCQNYRQLALCSISAALGEKTKTYFQLHFRH